MGDSLDNDLGFRTAVTPRDSLNGSLIGAGAALLESAAPGNLLAQAEPIDGPSIIGDYAHSYGKMQAV